jgi:P4 family phage/plasmid primase-like protien
VNVPSKREPYVLPQQSDGTGGELARGGGATSNTLPPDDEAPFERGDQVELGQRLIERLQRPNAPLVYAEGVLYQYDPNAGLWRVVDNAEQSRIVQCFAGATVLGRKGPLRLNAPDVAGALKLARDCVAKSEFFAEEMAGIAFADCVIEVTANGIRQHHHAPERRLRYGYSFAYPGNVAAPRFLRFLCDLFGGDADGEEKQALVQEFFGAAILGLAPVYQRCIVAPGTGENGKSKLAEIMGAAMPHGSTCAIPPQQWEQEYRRARLAGKRLNIVAELPEADIIASEAFKAIVTGDAIEGRHIREAPFTFSPRAAHYFAANRLPGTSDQTDGFWRRFLVLRFNRSFKNDPTKNPRIAEEIIAAELPAIVAWLLVGAARLLAHGAYTIPASHETEVVAWKRHADQVALFVEECTQPCDGDAPGAFARDVYRAYREWAIQNGHRPVAANTFGSRMAGLGTPSAHTEKANRYPLRLKRAEGLLKDFDGSSSGDWRGKSYGYA